MPSLKEIKGRIGSVKSTLKITSAMKLVASSKLRRAQQAIQSMLPYELQLHAILQDLMADYAAKVDLGKIPESEGMGGAFVAGREDVRKVALVALASNSSLCGGFNANAVRLALDTIREYRSAGIDVTVIAVGRKMAEAMRRAGVNPEDVPYEEGALDLVKLSEKPDYLHSSVLGQRLMDGFVSGDFDKVELVWNHFVSTASQKATRETFLPLSLSETGASLVSEEARKGLFIVEPTTAYQVSELLPKVLKLKVFTILLDSSAAEHAARTVAMQTATDNGEDLLQELTLDYNKGRQQKITSEILDIVGGSLK